MKIGVGKNDVLALSYPLNYGKLLLIWEKNNLCRIHYRLCPICHTRLIKHGRNKGGTRRYYCLNCQQSFSFHKKQKTSPNQVFQTFKKWITHSITLEFAGNIFLHRSKRTLITHFHKFLEIAPTPEEYFLHLKTLSISFGGTLLIDADWFGRDNCLIIYRDYPTGEIIFFRYAEGEYKNIVFNDLAFLIINGYPLKGVVSDWKGSIVAAVREISFKYFKGNLPHQRCLVHTQLQCQTFLTQRPKTEAGRNLLELVQLLNQANTVYHRNILFLWLQRFENRFLNTIRERTYSEDRKSWWYTHKYLRRTFLILKNNWDYLFVYLDYPFLVKDINGIEGLFSQLDNKLGRHRGLSKKNRGNFLYWFLYSRRFPNTRLSDIEKSSYNSQKQH